MAATAYWLNADCWVCVKHLPSVRISAGVEKCWYDCGTVRPPFKLPVERPAPPPTTPPLPKPKASPTSVDPPKPVVKAPTPPLTPAPAPPSAPLIKEMPVIQNEDGPTPEERRRGATFKTACLVCDTVLWRRKKDIEDGRRPFCCPAHRGTYEAQAREKGAA